MTNALARRPSNVPVERITKEPKVIKDQDYAREILNDLPLLIKEQPTGITLAHMMMYYGESAFRTMQAIEILKGQEKITMHKNAAQAYFILPKGYKPPYSEDLLQLTTLQRSLILFLRETAKKSSQHLVKTNYAQLSRVVKSSIGGTKAAVHRLESLGFCRIHQDSKRGLTDKLLLEVLVHE